MYLLESAVMSGMDPLNGRAPEQKIFPFFLNVHVRTKIKFGIKQADISRRVSPCSVGLTKG